MCIETCRYVHTPTDKDGSAWLLTLECAYSVYFEFGSFLWLAILNFCLFWCFVFEAGFHWFSVHIAKDDLELMAFLSS